MVTIILTLKKPQKMHFNQYDMENVFFVLLFYRRFDKILQQLFSLTSFIQMFGNFFGCCEPRSHQTNFSEPLGQKHQYINKPQNQKNKMGSQPSKPNQQGSANKVPNKSVQPVSNVPEDEYFIVEDINKMGTNSNDSKKYIWIDPKIYNSQNQKYLAILKEFIQVDAFTTVEGASQTLADAPIGQKFHMICAASLQDQDYGILQKQPKVEKIILFCQKQQRAKLLKNNFSKIASAQFNFDELLQAIKLNNKQKSSKGGVGGNNALFMSQDDTNLLNKYRLNYACLCQNHSEAKGKSDLVALGKKYYTQDIDNVLDFQKNFKVNLPQEQANKQILEWAFKKSFLWQGIDSLPRHTTDPKKLAYLRLPFRDLYRAIRTEYSKLQKRPPKLYIVTTLSKAEEKKFVQNLDNFVIFTTFVKGFTNQKDANKARKARQGSIMFEIILNKKERDESLDFGFVIDSNPNAESENVIFNIYNFFEIKQVELEGRRVEVTYAGLAQASELRKDKKKRIRPTPFQEDLLRNYDYIEDLMKRVNNQAAILQMSGYFKQSIEVYQNRSDFLRKSNANCETMDKYHLEVGDAYKLCDDLKKSQQSYEKISDQKMRNIAKIHKAQLFYQNKDHKKFAELVHEIEPKINDILQYNPPEAFKAMNYAAMCLMDNGDYKAANKKFRDILPILSKHYDYKYQGIPLVHDIFRNIASCQSKMKNYSEALNLLSSAKGWQKVCQGNSPNYALTETMIQQVHQIKGDQNRVKQSQAQLLQIKKSYTQEDATFLNKSKVMINLNDSMVNINLD